ncbi:MAG: hypothetical protein AAFQ63_17435 [Cyanobacteria bacterium J06621_11]
MTNKNFRSAAISLLKQYRADSTNPFIQTIAKNTKLNGTNESLKLALEAIELELTVEIDEVQTTLDAVATIPSPSAAIVSVSPTTQVHDVIDTTLDALAVQAEKLDAIDVEAVAIEPNVLEVIAELLVLLVFVRPLLQLKLWCQTHIEPYLMNAIAPTLFLVWDTKYIFTVVKPQQGFIDFLTLVMLGVYWTYERREGVAKRVVAVADKALETALCTA